MEQKTRAEQRQFIANCIVFEFQMGICAVQTYGDFVAVFESRMLEKIGECSDEDREWAFDFIDRFNKATAPKPAKKKSKE